MPYEYTKMPNGKNGNYMYSFDEYTKFPPVIIQQFLYVPAWTLGCISANGDSQQYACQHFTCQHIAAYRYIEKVRGKMTNFSFSNAFSNA